jgi:hypothetical protein
MESIEMKTQIERQTCASVRLSESIRYDRTNYVSGWTIISLRILVCILPLSINAFGTVESIEDLPQTKLVGVWEAMIQKDGVVGPGVYQMHFTDPENAYFVAMWSGALRPVFLGRLASCEISKGRVKLVFAAVSAAESNYDSVEIAARATYSGDEAVIDGQIFVKGSDGKVSTDRVFFLNRLWTQSISEASESARKSIENAKNPQPSPSR